jgi:sialic acid synthase SpsE
MNHFLNFFSDRNSKPYFIADIAANHDGDLERAFKLIELAKLSGADAAKFQNFKAEKIVSSKGFDDLGGKLSHQSKWKKSVFQVYKDASIDAEWTQKLKNKCDEVGIEYMSTPYDIESLELINPFVNAIKIGSGDITWHQFLREVAKKNKPVIISTGASSMNEVSLAIENIVNFNNQIVLMQCNTNYTGSEDNFSFINLNVLKEYKKQFPDFILGLSDHTPGHTTVLGAIALGARVIEKHFTDDTKRFGPDHSFSMDPFTWREMVDRSIELFSSLGTGNKIVEENEKESILVQRRGTYLTVDKLKGDSINREDLVYLRPISPSGISPYIMEQLVGKKLLVDKKKHEQLLRSELEK